MKNYKTICKNSILEKEYLSYLQNDEIEMISFDIFDTLVYRKESLPIEIFKKIGENSFIKNIFDTSTNFTNKRVVAEKEARRNNSIKEEIRLKDIYKKLPLTKKEQKRAIEIELKFEKKSIYINKQIENWIKLALLQDKKVVFISDIYFTKKELISLVFEKLKVKIKPENIFVSSELELSKATGNIYKKVLNILDKRASKILHIGDNFYSDVQMASKSGLNILHYSASEYINELVSLETSFKKSFVNSKVKEQVTILNPYKNKNENFFFNLGAYIFAPVLWEFSHYLKKLAYKKEVGQINFVMREGRLFKKCFELIEGNIDTKLIYASRKATFLSSLDINEIKSFNFNFYKYKDLTIEDLYALFELNIDEEHINENKLVKISNLRKDKKLEEKIIFDFKKRVDEIVLNIKNQKSLLKSYLKELNYKKGSMIVDFGGTGTILKTLSNIVEDKNSLKVLFYIHEQGNSNLLESNSFAYFESNKNDKTIELIRRTHQLIEVLLNGNETTTLAYKKDKRIEILREKLSLEMKENEASLNAFEEGIETFFSCAKRYILKEKSFKKEDLLNSIKRLIDTPLQDEVNYLGNLFYDKGIGKSFEKVIENQALEEIEKNGKDKFFYNYNSSLSFMIDSVVWPQGELTLYDNNYIKNCKGTVIKSVNSQSIDKILEKLDYIPEVKEIYIYAAGVFFKELLPLLRQRDIKIKAVFDTRAKLGNFVFEDFEVSYLNLEKIKEDEYIIIASAVFAQEIKDEIQSSVSVNVIDCL